MAAFDGIILRDARNNVGARGAVRIGIEWFISPSNMPRRYPRQPLPLSYWHTTSATLPPRFPRTEEGKHLVLQKGPRCGHESVRPLPGSLYCLIWLSSRQYATICRSPYKLVSQPCFDDDKKLWHSSIGCREECLEAELRARDRSEMYISLADVFAPHTRDMYSLHPKCR